MTSGCNATLRCCGIPCTQMKDHQQLPLIPINAVKACGWKTSTASAKSTPVSSWWVNVFGHANPRINQRIKDQVDQLEHVIPPVSATSR